MQNHQIPGENPNMQLATLFVETLAQAGLTSAVISPGSRSTPLTLAFEAAPEIETFLHIDERGAGFFALGLALAHNRPVALVCTSGTAVANYLPAIVEAQMSQVPLLFLTGDRPHELRHSGANQTIDQVKIFGEQVLWSVDMPLPQPGQPAVILRSVQTTAVRAYATASGLRQGPVHVNFPFRKPLEPTMSQWGQGDGEASATTHGARFTTHAAKGKLLPSAEQLAWLTAVLTQHPNGLIICGPGRLGSSFAQSVMGLARRTGYPILADPLSGVRFARQDAETAEIPSAPPANQMIISGYETFLQRDPGWPEPDIIVRFGAVPTSKWLNAYLEQINPAIRLHIRENGVWADDSHRTTHFLQLNETAVCQTLGQRLKSHRPKADWQQTIQATEQGFWRAMAAELSHHWFDGAAIATLLAHLPENAALFIGNSLPVRHLDQYGRSRNLALQLFGNRGASGIDGNIATGLGIAQATSRPTFMVVGDITALHDLNSLALARQMANVTIIVINNNGGGIFRRLPVSQLEPPFTERFLTPQNLTFDHAAALFGLAYTQVEGREQFEHAIATAVARPAPRLIELITDGQTDEQLRQTINHKVLNALNNA